MPSRTYRRPRAHPAVRRASDDQGAAIRTARRARVVMHDRWRSERPDLPQIACAANRICSDPLPCYSRLINSRPCQLSHGSCIRCGSSICEGQSHVLPSPCRPVRRVAGGIRAGDRRFRATPASRRGAGEFSALPSGRYISGRTRLWVVHAVMPMCASSVSASLCRGQHLYSQSAMR